MKKFLIILLALIITGVVIYTFKDKSMNNDILDRQEIELDKSFFLKDQQIAMYGSREFIFNIVNMSLSRDSDTGIEKYPIMKYMITIPDLHPGLISPSGSIGPSAQLLYFDVDNSVQDFTLDEPYSLEFIGYREGLGQFKLNYEGYKQ